MPPARTLSEERWRVFDAWRPSFAPISRYVRALPSLAGVGPDDRRCGRNRSMTTSSSTRLLEHMEGPASHVAQHCANGDDWRGTGAIRPLPPKCLGTRSVGCLQVEEPPKHIFAPGAACVSIAGGGGGLNSSIGASFASACGSIGSTLAAVGVHVPKLRQRSWRSFSAALRAFFFASRLPASTSR